MTMGVRTWWIFHKFYVRDWCGRIGCVGGGLDERGWDGMSLWTTYSEGVHLSIYLSIYSLNLNPDWNSMARPTRAFIQPLVPGGANKRQWPLIGEPPEILIYLLSDGPMKLAPKNNYFILFSFILFTYF
jgi:hypothetical protein